MSQPTYPQHPVVLEVLSQLDEAQREFYEERAGILEFDAGLDRPLAEALALLDVIRPLLVRPDITCLQVAMNEGTEWLLTTELEFARQYLSDIHAEEISTVDLAEVLEQQYSGIAALTTLG